LTQKPSPSFLRKNELIPHASPAERKRVDLMMDGKKIGTALVSADGTLTASVTDPKVAEIISPKREIQYLSIDTTFKK